MATFRKETFYTMRRLDDGSVGAVCVNGWTDGEYNYYSVKNSYSNLSTWFAIDKKTERYNEQVMQFYRAKIKAGAIVLLNNN